MTEHYDVIIIGTGAGGGTLASRLAPRANASSCWSVAATCRARRTTGTATRSSSTTGTRPPRNGSTETAIRSTPATTTTSAATPSCTARSCSACGRDFGEVEHHGGMSPAWPISLRTTSSRTTRGRRLYHVHGERGRTRPRCRAAAVPLPAGGPRATDPGAPRGPDGGGLHPFPCRSGSTSTRTTRRAGRCIRCAWFDGYPCLIDGKADADVLCVRPALEHANVTLVTHAKASGS